MKEMDRNVAENQAAIKVKAQRNLPLSTKKRKHQSFSLLVLFMTHEINQKTGNHQYDLNYLGSFYMA
jgi:hypothetical protein